MPVVLAINHRRVQAAVESCAYEGQDVVCGDVWSGPPGRRPGVVVAWSGTNELSDSAKRAVRGCQTAGIRSTKRRPHAVQAERESAYRQRDDTHAKAASGTGCSG